jgi:hypothetical protein
MTTSQVVLLVVGIVVIDLMIVGAVMTFLASMLNDMARRFPARAVLGGVGGSGAVRKEFQSIRVDMYNLGGCVHLTVDEACLHIEPAWVIRRVGGKSMSVPWEAIVLEKPLSARASRGVARIGGSRVLLPAWVLRLATPAGGGGATPKG